MDDASTYKDLVVSALQELQPIVAAVSPTSINRLLNHIIAANRIVCYGVGREGLAMRGLAMRLHHAGLQCSCVGDMACPPLGAGDLLLVSAGPGWFSTVLALAQQAKHAGAVVLAATANDNPTLRAVVDDVVVVPAQTLPADAHSQVHASTLASTSTLQMGSAYELALQLMFDILSILLQRRLGLTDADMKARHTNLE